MEDNYPKAYKEVIEILKYVPEESVNKIPQTMLDTFKTKMDKEYNFIVDINKAFEEQELLEETKAIFANIFRDYWATPYQKEKIDMLELEQQAIKIKKIKDIPIPLENIGKIKNTYYNPMYLLWAIKILGTTNVNIYFNNSNPKEPIYLKSELGEAIVLPIKQPKN